MYFGETNCIQKCSLFQSKHDKSGVRMCLMYQSLVVVTIVVVVIVAAAAAIVVVINLFLPVSC